MPQPPKRKNQRPTWDPLASGQLNCLQVTGGLRKLSSRVVLRRFAPPNLGCGTQETPKTCGFSAPLREPEHAAGGHQKWGATSLAEIAAEK
jgi:hypothetical protein